MKILFLGLVFLASGSAYAQSSNDIPPQGGDVGNALVSSCLRDCRMGYRLCTKLNWTMLRPTRDDFYVWAIETKHCAHDFKFCRKECKKN